MYDLVVIGSGPGGYIAAIRAAQLGLDVACVEKYDSYGGTCLNVGCIPSKALLDSSEKFAEVNHAFADHGINVGEVELDLDKMQARRRKVVEDSANGVNFLFGKNKVDGFHGFATIKDANTVEVDLNDGDTGTKTLETKKILIATGSKPSALPGIEYDDEYILDSTWALELDEVPEHLIVIGAGVIGLEMGSIWKRLGAKVTVIEYLPQILGGRADKEVMKKGKRIFEKQGLEFVMNAMVTGAEVKDGQVEVTYQPRDDEDASETLTGDKLLVAVGRSPYTEGLGLENIGLETDDRGFIHVDGNYETSVEGVYAIGDVIPGPMLAHLAEHEGVVAVERMTGMGSHVMYEAVPDVVYTHPEIASVGKTAEQLKEEGVEFKTGKFMFRANGRARAINDTDGFVKVLADAKTDRILGAHILGPQAGDLIAELAVAMEFWASSEDVARSSHAHPSLAEVVKEACLAVEGRALNS